MLWQVQGDMAIVQVSDGGELRVQMTRVGDSGRALRQLAHNVVI